VSVDEAAAKAKAEGPTDAAAKPDPFGSADQAKAKADFDDAFAAFTASSKGKPAVASDANKSTDAFNTEFPPISELEHEEESESESEQGGFEDDFSPASPPNKIANKPDAGTAEAEKVEETSANVVPPEVPVKEPLEDAPKR
jgi:epidermal growth factor receptor substrate 15